MRDNINIAVILVMSSFLLLSCGQDKKSALSVSSKGMPSELLLVVDDEIWSTDLTDSLQEITEGTIPGLMQREAYFDMIRVSPKNYVRRYTTMHSKLLVCLDANANESQLGIAYDISAVPQVQVRIVANNVDTLRSFLCRKKEAIRELINDAQIKMRMDNLKKNHNAKIDQQMKAHLGYSILVPKQVVASKKAQDFLWAGSNLNEKDLNIVVYTYPWDGTDVRTPEVFSAKRDSVMKQNIPGGREDQWMQTTRVDGLPVITSSVRPVDGLPTQVVRGLWEMRNGAMGGSFVSLVRIDTVSSKVIVAEGFAYSPSTRKRELIRAMEASLRTLKKSN